MITTRTETLIAPRRINLHIVDTDDVVNDEHQGELARIFARRFREELAWIEQQDNCAFAAIRASRNTLEQSAAWS